MKAYLLFGLVVALCLMAMNTTHDVSGDIMKACCMLFICATICFVWYY